MNALMIIASVLTVGSVLGLAGFVVALRMRSRKMAEENASTAATFSMDRYRPMERLLSQEDFAFLSQSPGYTPELGARWRKQQRRLFRLYLNELTADFHKLHAHARALVANSAVECPELPALLVRQEVQFWRALMFLEGRLMLDRIGLRSISTPALVQLVQSMGQELENVVPKLGPRLVPNQFQS